MALKLLGVTETDPAMMCGRFHLERGGISRTRIFTKLHLAPIGCYGWRGIPHSALGDVIASNIYIQYL